MRKMEKEKTGTCRLCGNVGLLRESHIISKLAYRPIKKIDKTFISYTSKRTKEVQDGPKEYLFCPTCEERRNPFETYFSGLVNRDAFAGTKKSYRLEGLDYSKLKLFVMWSIYAHEMSSHKANNIMERHIDDLEDMLLHDDAGQVEEYGFALWYLTHSIQDPRTLVKMPIPVYAGGGIVVDLALCGLFFRCLVEGRALPDLQKRFLQKDGSIVVERIGLREAAEKTGILSLLKSRQITLSR